MYKNVNTITYTHTFIEKLENVYTRKMCTVIKTVHTQNVTINMKSLQIYHQLAI